MDLGRVARRVMSIDKGTDAAVKSETLGTEYFDVWGVLEAIFCSENTDVGG
jgi:hypothetical protein